MKLRGAALQSRVEKQLREELTETYGLPMDDYECDIDSDREYYPGAYTTLYARFTRKNGACIQIDNIFTDDNGDLDQYSRPELG